MKLVRYGNPGKEKPGLIDAEGKLRDLSAVIKDIGPEQLSDAALAKLRKLKADKLPLVRGTPRMGCPLSGIGKFVAIGLNYSDHAAETGAAIPKEPIVFMKATTCIQGPDDAVMLPKGSVKTDWEVELGVVIGTRARYVSQKAALDHVAGYCTINDVSEREYQTERGPQWDKGKGCDTFGPIGPWLVTRDEIANVQKLAMWLDVNGQRRQTGNTRTMIFSVAKIVSYVSQFMTLMPGDVITEINGEAIVRSGDLSSRIALAAPGDTVRLKVWRDRAARELAVKLGRAEDDAGALSMKASEIQPGQLGLKLRELTREERASARVQGGLLVEEVAGAAARAGLMPGDVLLSINGMALKSVDQIKSFMDKRPKTVALLILRDGDRIFVPVELDG